LADLTELCRRNPACMAVCDSAEVLARLRLYPRPASAAGAPCRARELDMGARARLEPWRVASFSSLSSHAPVAAADGELPDHGDPAEAGEDAETAPGGLAGFARGSRAGTCLHEILERCDFSAIADVATERLTADILLKHGLDRRSAHVAVADPTETVLHMLGQLTDCELPDTNFKLAAIRREQRLNEWRFFLPMMRLSRRSLAHCFAREGRGHVSDPYATLLGELGSAAVHGFLTGFVDLVFEHEQRWYVVDWKSNHLGDEAGAYDAAALQRSMREQHYVLQYHLYVLALDRYLRQRLVGYDYERHFGGVYYAYLRGIRPGSRAGWYVDRPPRALILALDTLLREGDAP
jgi:exodeoxyribonuclease V beta subunit